MADGEVITRFHPHLLGGWRTGVLEISLPARRVLSLPTQLGCQIGCTFCVFGAVPLVRNLSPDEMLLR